LIIISEFCAQFAAADVPNVLAHHHTVLNVLLDIIYLIQVASTPAQLNTMVIQLVIAAYPAKDFAILVLQMSTVRLATLTFYGMAAALIAPYALLITTLI
jgi:hypothetical protein